MFNAKCNVRDNPKMQDVERNAQQLWNMLDKTVEQWKEYKECQRQLTRHWESQERIKTSK